MHKNLVSQFCFWCLDFVVHRIMTLQQCPHSVPWNLWMCYSTKKKKKRAFQMWSWDGEIILGYLDELMLLLSGKGRKSFRIRDMWGFCAVDFEHGGKDQWAKECRWSLEAGKSSKTDSVLQHQLLLRRPFPCLEL